MCARGSVLFYFYTTTRDVFVFGKGNVEDGVYNSVFAPDDEPLSGLKPLARSDIDSRRGGKTKRRKKKERGKMTRYDSLSRFSLLSRKSRKKAGKSDPKRANRECPARPGRVSGLAFSDTGSMQMTVKSKVVRAL